MKIFFVSMSFLILLGSCKSCNNTSDKGGLDIGVGPIKEVVLNTIDPEVANQGKNLFESKCSACHRMGEKYVGPDLKGITQRRSPEWVMNMMLNPAEMTQKDPTAKQLLETHLVQMTFQDLTKDDARKILEYFRQTDSK